MTDRCPNFAGYNLLASQLLVARVVEGRSLSRDRDLEEAFERAIAARDARRTWHGPSAEAVAAACHVALVAQDYPKALRVGERVPSGEATPDEAGDADVKMLVARARLGVGDFDGAAS